MSVPSDRPSFSHPVRVEGRDTEISIDLEANPRDRAAMAALYGLKTIKSFSVSATLIPSGGGGEVGGEGGIKGDRWLLEASFSASFQPICSVTLEPFDQNMSESIQRHYATDVAEFAPIDGESEYEIPADDALDPDPITNGMIDIGEAIAEEFAIRLDPYPRAPGADLSRLRAASGAESAENISPFAKLALLKDKNS